MFRALTFALALSALCQYSALRADDAEDKAIEFVKKIHGKVTRNEQVPGKPVLTIDLRAKVTDAGLKELAPLQNLVSLDIGLTKVTDAGVKELTALKNLNTLYLCSTKVTNAGQKAIQQALPKCNIEK